MLDKFTDLSTEVVLQHAAGLLVLIEMQYPIHDIGKRCP